MNFARSTPTGPETAFRADGLISNAAHVLRAFAATKQDSTPRLARPELKPMPGSCCSSPAITGMLPATL
jgi:hypothetical protein